MSRLQALLQQRSAAVEEGKALFARIETEGRALTAEESAKDDQINAKLEEIDAEIRRHERHRDRLKNESASAVSDMRDLGAERPWGATWGADRVLADRSATKDQRERARNLAFGEQLVAIYKAERGMGVDPRLFAAAPGQGQNETIGPDGGYLVGQQVSPDLNLAVWGGEILNRVSRTTLTSGVNSLRIPYLSSYSGADGSRHGGARAYWTEEGGTKTASRLSFDFWLAVLHKIAGLAYATDEILQDVGALGGLIFDALSAEIRYQVEAAIYAGDGVGKPLGFNVAANPALITVSKEAGQAAATILFENIAKMYMRMYPEGRSRAVWLVNADTEYALSTMTLAVGVAGVPVWMPAGGISGAPNSTLYGRPVIPTDFSPTLGTVGDIAFVDLSQYRLLEKGGIQTDTSIHVAFVSDETAFRAVLRVGGAPGWANVRTPAQGSSTVSPFVVLETRA